MRYKDIIDRMERRGDYCAARDYEDKLREHGHSEHERVDRYNPADGAQHTYTGDRAEEAFRDLRRDDERREEARREEEEAEERYRYDQARKQQEVEQADEGGEVV